MRVTPPPTNHFPALSSSNGAGGGGSGPGGGGGDGDDGDGDDADGTGEPPHPVTRVRLVQFQKVTDEPMVSEDERLSV